MKTRILLAVGLVTFGPVGVATAADQIYPGAESVEYKDASGWTFTIAAYGWLAGLKGNVGAGGRTAHVDASIGDVLSKFDIGVMGLAEAASLQTSTMCGCQRPPIPHSAFSPAVQTSRPTA